MGICLDVLGYARVHRSDGEPHCWCGGCGGELHVFCVCVCVCVVVSILAGVCGCGGEHCGSGVGMVVSKVNLCVEKNSFSSFFLFLN